MISLSDYLFEAMKSETISDLKVIYKVEESVTIQAPSIYSEDNVLTYLQDKTFEELPGSNKSIKKFFGSNYNKLIDVYFEYDGFERKENYDKDLTIEWDEQYDNREDLSNELSIFIFNNIKYVLVFEDFEIKTSGENLDSILDKIFKNCESSIINKYPLELKLEKIEK